LELFDGDDQQGNICYVATTNYIDKLPPRILRSGRFDAKMEVKNPPLAGRLAYLESKLGVNEDEEVIEALADATDGFSFGDMRELLVSVYCFEQDKDEVISRIKNGGMYESDSTSRKFQTKYNIPLTEENLLYVLTDGGKTKIPDTGKTRASRLLENF